MSKAEFHIPMHARMQKFRYNIIGTKFTEPDGTVTLTIGERFVNPNRNKKKKEKSSETPSLSV